MHQSGVFELGLRESHTTASADGGKGNATPQNLEISCFDTASTHIGLSAFSKAAVRLAVLDCNGSMATTHFHPKLERYSHLLTSGLVLTGAMQRAALPMLDRNASL